MNYASLREDIQEIALLMEKVPTEARSSCFSILLNLALSRQGAGQSPPMLVSPSSPAHISSARRWLRRMWPSRGMLTLLLLPSAIAAAALLYIYVSTSIMDEPPVNRLAMTISAVQACFVAVGAVTLLYTLRGAYWNRFMELQKFLKEYPYLYDLWYDSPNFDAVTWINNLNADQKVRCLVFLEMWGDSALALRSWGAVIGNYTIGFREPAQLVAKEMHLQERACYGDGDARWLGIR